MESKIYNTRNINDILSIENELEHPILPFETLKKDMTNTSYTFSVILYNEEIAGYINFADCIDHTDLISIAILPKYRGLGLAKDLITYMESYSTHPIFLEVRESNISAISLYEKLNYKIINIRKNYYSNPIEHALIYIKESPTK